MAVVFYNNNFDYPVRFVEFSFTTGGTAGIGIYSMTESQSSLGPTGNEDSVIDADTMASMLAAVKTWAEGYSWANYSGMTVTEYTEVSSDATP